MCIRDSNRNRSQPQPANNQNRLQSQPALERLQRNPTGIFLVIVFVTVVKVWSHGCQVFWSVPVQLWMVVRLSKSGSVQLSIFPTTFMFWVSFSSSLRMSKQNSTKMTFPSGLCHQKRGYGGYCSPKQIAHIVGRSASCLAVQLAAWPFS